MPRVHFQSGCVCVSRLKGTLIRPSWPSHTWPKSALWNKNKKQMLLDAGGRNYVTSSGILSVKCWFLLGLSPLFIFNIGSSHCILYMHLGWSLLISSVICMTMNLHLNVKTVQVSKSNYRCAYTLYVPKLCQRIVP